MVAACTGDEGDGKSSLAAQLAACTTIGCNPRNPADLQTFVENNFILNPNPRTVIDYVNRLPKYSALVLDEAVKAAYKRLFMSKEQIKLNRFFATCRKQYKAVFMCIPDIFDLDTFYRNRRVIYWFHVIGRDRKRGVGFAAFFKRRKLTAGQDVWQQKEMQKTLDKAYGKLHIESWDDINNTAEIARKLPNFVSLITFYPMPPKMEARYLEKVDEVKEDMGTDDLADTTLERKYKYALRYFIRREMEAGETCRSIADKCGLGKSTVNNISKYEDFQ